MCDGGHLCGATFVIGVDSVPGRLEMAKRMGADVTLNFKEQDVVAEIKKLTGGGVDVAIEALGQQATFENALRCLRPGGTVSSLGVYSRDLAMPLDAYRCRTRRPVRLDDPLPRRQRAHAAPDERRAREAIPVSRPRHAFLPARPHRRGVRSVRAPSGMA